MRGRLFLAIGLASALRVPPLRLSATSPSAGSSKALYAQIDTVLRRGQKKGSSPLAMNTARALGKRWMEMPPADLVEATLVSGGLLLESYEEGLAILLEAEEGAGVNVSGKCYSALMRLAQSQERPEDVLRLMARTRAIGVETTDGQLLGAMRAAASLEDWGAVARLYAELSEGGDAAASRALELETIASDPQVLEEIDELYAVEAGSKVATRAKSTAPPTEREYALALSLALQAHCERGDLARVGSLLERKRAQQSCLGAEEYKMLLGMATRLNTPAPLLLLRPIDLQRSLEAELEPGLFAVTNRIGVLAAALGRIERVAVVATAVLTLIGAIAVLSGALDSAPDVADMLAVADSASSASRSGSFGSDVAALLY